MVYIAIHPDGRNNKVKQLPESQVHIPASTEHALKIDRQIAVYATPAAVAGVAGKREETGVASYRIHVGETWQSAFKHLLSEN